MTIYEKEESGYERKDTGKIVAPKWVFDVLGLTLFFSFLIFCFGFGWWLIFPALCITLKYLSSHHSENKTGSGWCFPTDPRRIGREP